MYHSAFGPRRVAFLIVATGFAILFWPATVRAQCAKDTDCKGDRVCRMGACEDPTPVQPVPPVAAPGYAPAGPTAAPGPAGYPPPTGSAPQPAPTNAAPPPGYYPPPAPPPGYYPPAGPAYGAPPTGYTAPAGGPPTSVQADPGWAAGAATYGIISGVAVLALAIGAEATKADEIPATPMGGVATALFAASVPIVAIGGSSARTHPAVTGSLGLRIAGWISYGVALADAAYLLSQSGKSEPDDGLILSVGLLGAASMACFVVDARISAAQATSLAGPQGYARAQPLVRGGVLAPVLLRDPSNPARLAAGLAWASTF